MSSDSLELKEKARAEYLARWEAVETFESRELAANDGGTRLADHSIPASR